MTNTTTGSQLNQISEATCAEYNVTTLTQKTFGAEGVGGDCLRTAIACLLGLPDTDSTPHFCDRSKPNHDWVGELREYLHGFGICDMWCNAPDHLTENFNGVVGILSGKVERTDLLHSVVAVVQDQKPVVIWDPHPSRVGLLEDGLEDFLYFAVLHPTRGMQPIGNNTAGHKQENDELRKASGEVVLDCRLTHFLYLLMRDHIPVGTVEELRRSTVGCGVEEGMLYTNGYLARYANYVASNLSKGKGQ